MPGSHGPGTTSPREQMACLRHRLTLHSNYNYRSPSSPQAWVRKSPLINHWFNPVLSGQEQKPEGNLHADVRSKQKQNLRSCVNKEEKGKFLYAASVTVDWIPTINLRYPASVECLNRQWINPKLRQWTLKASVNLGFAVCDWLVSDFYVYLSIVFSVCYHWWICLLVWLLSFFLFFLIFLLLF